MKVPGISGLVERGAEMVTQKCRLEGLLYFLLFDSLSIR